MLVMLMPTERRFDADQSRERVKQTSRLLLSGQGPAEAVPSALHAVSDGVVAGDVATSATLGCPSPVLAGIVAGAATTDVIDWSLVLHHLTLTLELLVEAEDRAFLLVVHVTGTATAGGIIGVGVGGAGDGELGARGRAGGIGRRGDLGRVDVLVVTSTATTRVDVMACRQRWVWLRDAVGRDHFDLQPRTVDRRALLLL